MSSLASVYQRGRSLVLTSSSRVTSIGWWKENGWTSVLGAQATDAELGAALSDALAASGEVDQDVPVPDGPSHAARALGLSSESTFLRGTRFVGLEENDGEILVTSHRRQSGGFLAEKGMPEERVSSTSDPADLGAAVRRMLDAST